MAASASEALIASGAVNANAALIAELRDIHLAAQYTGSARAEAIYEAALDSVIGYGSEISQKNMPGRDGVASLPSIGDKMIDKFSEFFETGKIKTLMSARGTPEFAAFKEFITITGVGPVTARTWVNDKGYRKIEDVHDEDLNRVQRIGITHRADLATKIPRDEITRFIEPLAELYKGLAPGNTGAPMSLIVAGSYRRGAMTSGDIDVIVSGPRSYIPELTNIIEKLSTYVTTLSAGPSRVSLLVKPEGIVRQLDILYAPPNEYAAAILYFTGSAAFNAAMRGWAKALDMRLNQHGLYAAPKLATERFGRLVPTKNEEAIFAALGLAYVAPVDRNGGGAVVPL